VTSFSGRRFNEVAHDMVNAIGLGGVPTTVRAQVPLRRNGFSDVPLDGQDRRSCVRL